MKNDKPSGPARKSSDIIAMRESTTMKSAKLFPPRAFPTSSRSIVCTCAYVWVCMYAVIITSYVKELKVIRRWFDTYVIHHFTSSSFSVIPSVRCAKYSRGAYNTTATASAPPSSMRPSEDGNLSCLRSREKPYVRARLEGKSSASANPAML